MLTENGLVVPNTYYSSDPNTNYLRYMSPLDSFTDLMIGDSLCLSCKKDETTSVEKTYNEFKKTGLYSKNMASYVMNAKESWRYRLAGNNLLWRGIAYVKLKYCRVSGLIDVYSAQLSDPNRFVTNFLMEERTSLVTGVTLADRFRKKSLYCCIEIRILEEVGYATSRRPRVIEFANEYDFHSPTLSQ